MGLTSLDVLQQSGTLSNYRQEAEAKKDLDKDAFLKILVAQLTYQDPLNPMDDKEFIAQLAQFTSLEQLTNIAGSMETMIDNQNKAAISDAVGLIGKEVSATGYSLSKEGGAISKLNYYFETDIESGYINVYDKDYNLKYTQVLGAKQAGTMHEFKWDGKDYNGNPVPDGIYTVGIAGEDKDGSAVYIQMEVSGKVDGVITEGGKTYLVLEDGRYVDYGLVGEISQGKKATTDEEAEEEAEEETEEETP